MNGFRNLVLVLIILGPAFGTLAQTNFQVGTVVNSAGDSLRGWIDHKEWSKNPRTIEFKKLKEDITVRTLSVRDIMYFEAEGEAFVRYVGHISTDKNSVRPADVLTISFVTDTVFLKVLAVGDHVSLFSYRDKLKNRYFLSLGQESPEELIYRFYPSDEGDANQVVVDDRYKHQLINAAQKAGAFSDKVRWLIGKATYGTESLTTIVDKINGETKKEIAGGKKSGVQFFAGAGVNRTQLHFPDYGWVTSSQTSYAPYFTAGVNILPNPYVGKLFIRGELSFGIANLHLRADSAGRTAERYIDYASTQYTYTLAGNVFYNFYNTPGLKVYGGAGIRFNTSSYSNHTFTIQSSNSAEVMQAETGFESIPVWMSLNLQAGIILHGKFELTASYSPQLGQFNSTDTVLGQSISYNRVGINYHFGGKK